MLLAQTEKETSISVVVNIDMTSYGVSSSLNFTFIRERIHKQSMFCVHRNDEYIIIHN